MGIKPTGAPAALYCSSNINRKGTLKRFLARCRFELDSVRLLILSVDTGAEPSGEVNPLETADREWALHNRTP